MRAIVSSLFEDNLLGVFLENRHKENEMSVMKAIIVEEAGSPDVLQIKTVN